ncbi:hypothetical protein MGG_16774 [Pyricularia oryzae 70-15]|uniref:Uncharacterized protein n=3 Tax=Pyricularia oryzae TaxID=318829 RepID=G4N0G6_PYRO7|nr:uncharacterized protein MGG_16774 [Pyricularia oryzae 70-15]EHA52300.1 hypothetical protein MGG_16774 [Pyricularia oryzae 70-15]ELQ44776.1 hypothetical protein OOU_Y34scaffold00051g3 [Pyricularia oryzae Y34]
MCATSSFFHTRVPQVVRWVDGNTWTVDGTGEEMSDELGGVDFSYYGAPR